jgi:hypothetical protein
MKNSKKILIFIVLRKFMILATFLFCLSFSNLIIAGEPGKNIMDLPKEIRATHIFPAVITLSKEFEEALKNFKNYRLVSKKFHEETPQLEVIINTFWTRFEFLFSMPYLTKKLGKQFHEQWKNKNKLTEEDKLMALSYYGDCRNLIDKSNISKEVFFSPEWTREILTSPVDLTIKPYEFFNINDNNEYFFSPFFLKDKTLSLYDWALYVEICKENSENVKLLLKNGACANNNPDDHPSFLAYAYTTSRCSQRSDREDILMLLIEYGANIEVPQKYWDNESFLAYTKKKDRQNDFRCQED